jgi:hypothetical protein
MTRNMENFFFFSIITEKIFKGNRLRFSRKLIFEKTKSLTHILQKTV